MHELIACTRPSALLDSVLQWSERDARPNMLQPRSIRPDGSRGGRSRYLSWSHTLTLLAGDFSSICDHASERVVKDDIAGRFFEPSEAAFRSDDLLIPIYYHEAVIGGKCELKISSKTWAAPRLVSQGLHATIQGFPLAVIIDHRLDFAENSISTTTGRPSA